MYVAPNKASDQLSQCAISHGSSSLGALSEKVQQSLNNEASTCDILSVRKARRRCDAGRGRTRTVRLMKMDH